MRLERVGSLNASSGFTTPELPNDTIVLLVVLKDGSFPTEAPTNALVLTRP